jgi:hypothetical protein
MFICTLIFSYLIQKMPNPTKSSSMTTNLSSQLVWEYIFVYIYIYIYISERIKCMYIWYSYTCGYIEILYVHVYTFINSIQIENVPMGSISKVSNTSEPSSTPTPSSTIVVQVWYKYMYIFVYSYRVWYI